MCDVSFDLVTLVCCDGCNPALMLAHRGNRVDGASQQELRVLIEEEKKLDELIQSCTWQVHQLCENQHCQRYPFYCSFR